MPFVMDYCEHVVNPLTNPDLIIYEVLWYKSILQYI
jgi:hypothetical protein